MPIRPELRHFYACPEWDAARARILERAGDRCERCGAPNRAVVLRTDGSWWAPLSEQSTVYFYGTDTLAFSLLWACVRTAGEPKRVYIPKSDRLRWVRIVLTIAHLNHLAGDDRDDNLQAMCQWCHLAYDERFHRGTRCDRKDAARPILSLLNLAANS